MYGGRTAILLIGNHFCPCLPISGEKKYLDAPLKPPITFWQKCYGYSFVTGYGSKPVMNPHFRLAASDDIPEPYSRMGLQADQTQILTTRKVILIPTVSLTPRGNRLSATWTLPKAMPQTRLPSTGMPRWLILQDFSHLIQQDQIKTVILKESLMENKYTADFQRYKSMKYNRCGKAVCFFPQYLLACGIISDLMMISGTAGK